MGKLAVYKFGAMMFLVVQVILAVFTIVALFGGNVTPVGNTARAMLVYALPVLILANVVIAFYWVIRRKWFYLLIPIIVVACCLPYIGTLWQPLRSLDIKAADAQQGLKIATYNVCMFNRETSGFIAQDVLAEMKRQKVDVLCIQEYNEVSGDKVNTDSYKEYFPYMAMGKSDMVIFSRFPIKGNKTFTFEDTGQSAMWADIDYKGNMLRVFNVHLQTTGINRTKHQADKYQAKGMDIANNRLMQAFFGNYVLGMMFRSGQAIEISNEKMKSDKPVIMCGDFNDVPYSYVYNTMLGNMVDGFKECGAGFMRTFREPKKPVRIDYIFHDEALKGLTYYKTDMTYSDHFPVFMKVTFN